MHIRTRSSDGATKAACVTGYEKAHLVGCESVFCPREA